jgi:putative Ca2+/H+ antiporter (TMEM165/GDT1 family)
MVNSVVASVEQILAAAGLGAIAELGGRSQFMLFVVCHSIQHKKHSVVGAMAVAVVLSHLPVGLAAIWFAGAIQPSRVHWLVALLLFVMAAVAVCADLRNRVWIVRGGSVFVTVLLTIFVAELGDRSQLASAAVAAEDRSLVPLAAAMFGCIAVNLPVAMAGPWLADKLVALGVHLTAVSAATAVLFAGLGVLALVWY